MTLGDPTFLYLPVAMTELIGPRGSRWMAVGLRGATPHDPASSLARAQTLAEVVRRARAAASAQRG
ncbi:MAG: hypothetical protein R3F14_00475 [Polyangiaceae bacterium]